MQTDNIYRKDTPLSPLHKPSHKAEMLGDKPMRFIHNPAYNPTHNSGAGQGENLIADLSGRLPLPEGACVYEIAPNRTAIIKLAEKCAHPAPADFAQSIYELLRTRALNLLGLARKAGAIECGFTKVQIALATQKAYLLLNAADSADGGAKKLATKAANNGIDVAASFSTAELSAALGRENIHHIVVSKRQFFTSIHNALFLIDNFNHKDDKNGSR